MTAKTSFFNKGIYKSTIKRNILGSVIYFVFLFLCTSLYIMLSYEPYAAEKRLFDYYDGYNLLLSSGNMILPLLFTIVVPTVTGLLVFRFMHSKKASIFTHSLPVSRKANFISSVCAGYTLMALPVILNGIILMLMSSLGGYSGYFTVTDCLVWMGTNLFSLFIMFSCTAFVATLTGNSFALVVLNILIHTLLLITGACLMLVADIFLYGFSYDNSLVTLLSENTFPSMVFNLFNYSGIKDTVTAMSFILPIAVALLFYATSVVLSVKRRNETVGDVAGFRVLNHIFKYLVTLLSALVVFAIFYSTIKENPLMVWIMIAIIGTMVYFGTEMLLKKTVRVWKSYKGLLIEGVVFAVFMVLISETSFFGYESRVPDKEDVKRIVVDEGYYSYMRDEITWFEDKEVIELGTKLHKKIVDNPPKIDEDSVTIFISYELKNGSTLSREYPITYSDKMGIYKTLYECMEYKKANQWVFRKFDVITEMYVGNDEITDKAERQEIIECLRKDVTDMDYVQLHSEGWGIELEMEYKNYDDDDGEEAEERYDGHSVKITPDYKNAVKWLKDNGYWESNKIENEGTFYIASEYDNFPYGKTSYRPEMSDLTEQEAVEIKGEEADVLIEYIMETPYVEDGEIFNVYNAENSNPEKASYVSKLSSKQVEELKELLNK